MERKTDRKGQEDSGREELSIAESIKALAAFNARANLADEKQLTLFLQSWWSRTYNRPLKDPLLQTYTLEELLYEFYDRIERHAAEQERVNSENDKIEEEKEKADLDWAELEEKRELEAMKAQAAGIPQAPSQPSTDPAKDPANIAWMEEQMRKAKAIYGENFGEDIDEDF